MLRPITLGLFSIFAASAAQAQFSATGEIAAHYLESDGTDWSAASADFTLGYRFNDTWSVELGLDASRTQFASGYQLDGRMTFATISAHTDAGRFQIGRPRTVIDEYIAPQMFINEYASKVYMYGELFSMAFDDIYLDINDFRGARYDGSFGNTKVAAAVIEEIDGSKDLYFQFAATHTIDAYTFAVGLERETTDDETSAYFSANADWDKVRGSFYFRNYEDSSGFRMEVYNLGLDYDVSDKLSIEAMYTFMGSYDDVWKSLSVSYDFTDSAYIAVAGGDYNYASEPLVSLTLGWRLDY